MSEIVAPNACQIIRLLCVESRPCNRCGATVYFVVIGDKPRPFDADGSGHWNTCPGSPEKRKTRGKKPAAVIASQPRDLFEEGEEGIREHNYQDYPD